MIIVGPNCIHMLVSGNPAHMDQIQHWKQMTCPASIHYTLILIIKCSDEAVAVDEEVFRSVKRRKWNLVPGLACRCFVVVRRKAHWLCHILAYSLLSPSFQPVGNELRRDWPRRELEIFDFSARQPMRVPPCEQIREHRVRKLRKNSRIA